MAEPRAERPYMPDYGVDTPSWVPLPWSWAAERLTANQNFWLVTVSATGRPDALPVWGVWDDPEARFAFSCGSRARKLRNLAANPQAVIMVDSTVECVSIEGRAAPVRDDDRQEQWIELYLRKYQPIAPDLSPDFLWRRGPTPATVGALVGHAARCDRLDCRCRRRSGRGRVHVAVVGRLEQSFHRGADRVGADPHRCCPDRSRRVGSVVVVHGAVRAPYPRRGRPDSPATAPNP